MPHRPQPPLHPGTGQPVGPDDLAPLFPMALILQEVSTDREIAIPRRGARRLPAVAADAALPRAPARAGARHRARASTTSTRASRPAGTHKPNTAVAQAFYNSQGRASSGSPPRPAPASGARRWRSPAGCSASSARSTWCGSRYEQKPYRRVDDGDVGRRGRAPARHRGHQRRPRRSSPQHPDSPGSLGIAISEAVEDAATRDDTSYSLGSRAEPRAAAPDGDRPGGAAADGAGRRVPATSSSAASAAARTSPASRCPFVRDKIAGAEIDDHRLRAGRLPDADPRPVRLRLRRHRPS